jgi:hypothetical protein
MHRTQATDGTGRATLATCGAAAESTLRVPVTHRMHHRHSAAAAIAVWYGWSLSVTLQTHDTRLERRHFHPQPCLLALLEPACPPGRWLVSKKQGGIPCMSALHVHLSSAPLDSTHNLDCIICVTHKGLGGRSTPLIHWPQILHMPRTARACHQTCSNLSNLVAP